MTPQLVDINWPSIFFNKKVNYSFNCHVPKNEFNVTIFAMFQ